LKQEGATLYYGQVLTNVTLQRCWKEVVESSDYTRRQALVEKFNGYGIFSNKEGIIFARTGNMGHVVVICFLEPTTVRTAGEREHWQSSPNATGYLSRLLG
jgi:hypothetical protein